MQEGGRRDFCQLHDVFQKSNGPSLRYYHVLKLFYVMKEFIYTCITRVVVVVVVSFFNILPSEFQVMISGSKKQQQKDSYIHTYIHILY